MQMENPTIVMIGALGGTMLLLAIIASVWPGNTQSQSIGNAAQILTPFILAATVVILYYQLGHIQTQNELQRTVASKSAIQELNKVLLDEQQDDFLRFVFPNVEKKDARQAMMAFSLMNSLEMLYLTREKKKTREAQEAAHEEFKSLLMGFISNVRVHWKGGFPAVYHPDFQDIVQEAFAAMEKEAKQTQ